MAAKPKSFLPRGARRAASVAAVTALGTFVMLWCYVMQPRILLMLDYKVYDAFLHTRPTIAVSGIPVIIDLDEASLDAYGQWPWPRFLLAALLQKLEEAGVSAVGLDILFSEEDRSSPGKIRDDLNRFLAIDVAFQGLPEALYDYDALLAKSLRMDTVLGMYCNFAAQVRNDMEANGTKTAAPGQRGTDSSAPTPEQTPAPDAAAPPPAPVRAVVQRSPGAVPYETHLHKTGIATLPLPVFRPVAPVGMINMNADLDGVVRRIPLLGVYDGKLYASLSLRTLMAALHQQMLFLRTGPDGLESVRVGEYTVPLAPDGSMTLPFKGPARTFPYYSVKDVLEGGIGKEQLAGRIAFLGTSAPGLLDIRITPLERVYPGVEAHATALDAILTQSHLRVPPWTPGLQTIAIVLAGLVSGVAFGFARPKIYVPVAALLLGGTVYGAYHFFGQGLIISPLYVSLTIFILGAVLLVLRFWQEEKQKNVLRSAFSRYVAPEVVERIANLEGDIFAGEEHELSIMFTDIRGFTSISEKLSPKQIVSLLNHYFTPMTALVRGNKGTLDKFIGDALMAFWNAPVPVPGHPHLATLTALQMQEKLLKLNVELEAEFGVSVRMGVGVHTGKAYVGNMGSEELLNYTLIGDNVNLASRLEGLCSQFGVLVVVSAETKGQCGDGIAFLPLDTLRVKGKKQPVSTFTVMRPEEREQNAAEYDRYLAAQESYVRGDFAVAYDAFASLVRDLPGKKLYALYLERCETLLQSPPKEWDGIWTLTSK